MLKNLKRKTIIFVAIAFSVVMVFLILFFTLSGYAHFKRVTAEAGRISGFYGKGFNYLELDTKPIVTPYDEMTAVQKNIHLQQETKAIQAIKHTNEELGFGQSLYAKMYLTTEYMGAQRIANDKYIVTWTYNKDKGLEVKYQIKTFAMFKIGV